MFAERVFLKLVDDRRLTPRPLTKTLGRFRQPLEFRADFPAYGCQIHRSQPPPGSGTIPG